MQFSLSAFLLVLALRPTAAFVNHNRQDHRQRLFSLFAEDNGNAPNVDRMKELIQGDVSNPNMMKAAAEQMKNLTPDQIDAMVRDMETMNPIQKQALKALGMDPEAMKQTMKMMKDNPQMIESAQKLMENMTPEQMMEQSRRAQEQMRNLTPEQLKEANAQMSKIPKEKLDEAVEILSKERGEASGKSDTKPTVIATGPGTSSDPNVIRIMYQVAELMSNDGDALSKGIGGVTLAGFSSLPVIQLLSGPKEEDLSTSELKECWAAGSLGATRVDEQGFNRVWNEVQDYFEDDIMGEARKEAKRRVSKKKRGSPDEVKPTSPVPPSTPQVGASLTEEQLSAANEQFKSMNDDDMSAMFEAMQNMDPATEARLKAMGTDPNMLRQTAKLMNSNPMMKRAAKEMIKNMSGKDMLKVSQQAQEQMKNMSPEEIQSMMNMKPEMEEAMKNMSMEEIQEAMKGMEK